MFTVAGKSPIDAFCTLYFVWFALIYIYFMYYFYLRWTRKIVFIYHVAFVFTSKMISYHPIFQTAVTISLNSSHIVLLPELSYIVRKSYTIWNINRSARAESGEEIHTACHEKWLANFDGIPRKILWPLWTQLSTKTEFPYNKYPHGWQHHLPWHQTKNRNHT